MKIVCVICDVLTVQLNLWLNLVAHPKSLFHSDNAECVPSVCVFLGTLRQSRMSGLSTFGNHENKQAHKNCPYSSYNSLNDGSRREDCGLMCVWEIG